MTLKEASAAIVQKLDKRIHDPVINIVISCPQYEGVGARATGAVQHPRSFPYCEGMTVLDLLREAGGVTDAAILNRAALYRSDGSRPLIRLDHLLEGSDMATNYSIRPGDTLVVPKD